MNEDNNIQPRVDADESTLQKSSQEESSGSSRRGARKWIIIFIVLLCVICGMIILFEMTKPSRYNMLSKYDVNMMDKPMIYLYPEKETDVSVTLGHPENITVSYPLYKNFWQVHASPDGSLTDKTTGQKLYGLYYEASGFWSDDMSEGFVVAKDDIIPFLEKQLSRLGLTETEAEEFIIYWLPQMMASDYVYVHFFERKEIEQAMPLRISPAPDTLIRVLMGWKPLDNPIDVKPQQLSAVNRAGFTAVEWGGVKLF